MLTLLAVSTHVKANRVIVKGIVKSATTGLPLANKKVTISVAAFSGTNQCSVTHYRITNPNGVYYDTLECTNADITKIQTSTEDCNGKHITLIETVPSTKIVELNFSICTHAPVPTCEVAFTFDIVKGSLQAKFNSTNAHGSTATDNIIKRRWRFGDGTILEGNEINPSHVYKKAGTYEACLTIITSAGCEKTLCKSVKVEAVTTCEAAFTLDTLKGSLQVKFSSTNSHGASISDNIIKRRWRFGDGAILEGNEISPNHIYARTGTYEVCLTIITVAGCEKTSCKTINVVAPTAICKADFTLAITGKLIKLNSINSQSNPGDITSRKWTFGDGSVLEGNIKDPSHEYKHAGTYEVCLAIKTIAGCESKQCKQIIIAPQTATTPLCNAKFTFEKISPKKIRFNSSNSVNSSASIITERKWDFGDGTVLGGNEINPAKEYARAGHYTVCLTIKAGACLSKTCTTIKIEDTSRTNTPATTNAYYIKIISLRPNPATSPLTTEVWSLNNNIPVELSIYDIYGVKKWSANKVLFKGTTVTVIPTSQLASGPYFFRVSTMYGVLSKSFYKL